MSQSPQQTVMVFDIETIPDADAGRRLHGLDGLSEGEVVKAMQQLRMQEKGNDFQPHHLQRVVAIAVCFRDFEGDRFELRALGDPDTGEAALIRQFFALIDKYRPILVSWNGSGFDLPVLHYRALLHGIEARAYWNMDGEMKWDNYIGRYQWRHTDLMDVLSGYQPRASAKLDEVAQLIGYPGKIGLSGDRVWEAWCQGRSEAIRRYCETDVLNTFLVWLRFERQRGRIDAAVLAAEEDHLRDWLAASPVAEHREFLDAWRR